MAYMDDESKGEQNAADASVSEYETDQNESEEGRESLSEQPSPEELQLTLQDAQAKAEEYWNQLLRAKAEIANLHKRNQRDVQNAHKYGLEKLVVDLLPIIDSLELGLKAAEEDGNGNAKVREGFELTLKMMLTCLEKFGVNVVNPEGDKFDPEFHQAMTMQPDPNAEPNTVLTVFQKGYLLNERLIRPAMVVVASSVPEEKEETETEKSDDG